MPWSDPGDRPGAPLPRWTGVVPVLLAAWLAAANVTTAPWAMNPDGVSYLDQAAAWRAGDFANAINSYWSPGYLLLLAAWGVLTAPLGIPTVPGAHLLNVACAVAFAVAAARLHRRLDDALRADAVGPRRRWAVWLVQLVLVALVVGVIAPVSLLTPDLLLAAASLVLWTAALRLLARPTEAVRSWLWLGLLVGACYLVKTPGLPVGVLVVGGTVLSVPGVTRRTFLRRTAASALGCALVVLPWGAALSRADGTLTLGTSAAMNRGWSWSGGVLRGIHGAWQPVVRAVPPTAYGTMPIWYAPHRYIASGVPADAPVVTQAVAVARRNLLRWPARRTLLHLTWLTGLAAGALLLVGSADARRRAAILVVPSLAGVVMYLVVHLEDRYLVGFVLPIGVAAAASVASLRGPMLAWLGVPLLAVTASMGRPLRDATWVPVSTIAPHPDADVLAALREAGIRPGTAIAVVGEPFRALWAFEAQVRVVATLELRSPPGYDGASPRDRAGWESAFRAAGATAVVLTDGPHRVTLRPL